MKDLRLAMVQMRTVFGDIGGNARRIGAFMREAADKEADIVCFPESSLTGYSTDRPSDAAVPADSTEIGHLEDVAGGLGLAVSFGFLEENGDLPYISQIVSDGKDRVVYRKTHLGDVEGGRFSEGSDLPVLRTAKAVVGMQLCWESHIPDISTALRRKGCEIALVPYSCGMGGEKRIASWRRYLPARADDNGMYVAACNACGENGKGAVFGGGIAVYGPKGETLREYCGTGEKMEIVDLPGPLPRDRDGGMGMISYFDRRREEIYR